MTKPRYVVELEPTPDCKQPIPALRKFLKQALRAYGLRCRSVVEAAETPDIDGETEIEVSDR